ncbi:MAG: SMP-30/gluconolactonase/LRE family protein, partial [Cyclobacteriaceae bacterium]|nr:SMP-30/gluconolactonase/LRE family protein [Cyclobacteriaceae bacterium]
MKKSLLALVLLVVMIIAYAFSVMKTTGFFREIIPYPDPLSYTEFPISGVEDMAISRLDSFLILSADDRASRRNGKEKQGALYLLDLKNGDNPIVNLTENLPLPLAPHGISLLSIDTGYYQLYVINHALGKHSVEVFELTDGTLSHMETLSHPAMIQPNDIVTFAPGRFYFTNDHKYTSGLGEHAENYLGLALSNVVYVENGNYREVANGIAYANGIAFDTRKKLVYVSSPRRFQVNVYNQLENGDLDYLEALSVNTGVDNVELDENGDLWIGCHPNLLQFTSYVKGKKPIAPSEVIVINYNGKNDYSLRSVFLDDGTIM